MRSAPFDATILAGSSGLGQGIRVMPEPSIDQPDAAAARLRHALDALADRDADVARALARIGHPAPRTRPPGFATLLRIITAQQLSTKAAAAIQGRLDAAMGQRIEPETYLALDDVTLRGCGLSARKIVYGRHLAKAMTARLLDLEALADAPDEAVVEALTALPGFGRWSAEIYLLFALQRLDVLPADDLALQVGFQRLKGLAERPKAGALREATRHWAPWRGAAAVFLWHFYGAATLDAPG
jgi:DNA-3-methyladenine glycosylase II